MKGRAGEIVEMLERRRVDVCCVQEVRWRGASARFITGKERRYKFFWVGNSGGVGGVGILLAEEWVDKVIEVVRVCDRIIKIRLVIGNMTASVVSAYAPQQGLTEEQKDCFYDTLLQTTSMTNDSDLLIMAGDFNGHVGQCHDGYSGVHGGYGHGTRNEEGLRLLEFCDAIDLTVCNTNFRKPASQLITYQSGEHMSQIDYILTRKRDRQMVINTKSFPGEECTTQHRLVTSDIRVRARRTQRRKTIWRRRVWKLKDPMTRHKFKEALDEAYAEREGEPETYKIEDNWVFLRDNLLRATDRTCGWGKVTDRRKGTWWWNDTVDRAIKAKGRAWKEWKKGGSRELYQVARREARRQVYVARREAESRRFSNVLGREDQRQEVFRIARQCVSENQDVVGESCVRNDRGDLATTDDDKTEAWQCHHDRLLNTENVWERGALPNVDPTEGPAVKIDSSMIEGALKDMKTGKAAGPSGLVAEMLKTSGDVGRKLVTCIVNQVVQEGVIPNDWCSSIIINCYKGKGDALERGNYRGIKLMDQVMKMAERIIAKLIRERVNLDEMQFGFVPGRGTTDALFLVRQLQEKFLAKGRPLYLAFVDLEKAFDRVPRDLVWWALRKLGVDEWLVRAVQAMYRDAVSRVRVGGKLSREFSVQVGVHQGSVLSPLLFIIVLQAITEEFRTGCPWELLYADDLVLIAESLEDLEKKFQTWKQNLESRGLKVNIGKTKVLVSRKEDRAQIPSGKWPCAICRKGVGRNSIRCTQCKLWTHKRCSGITGSLTGRVDFVCGRCTGAVSSSSTRQIDSFKCQENTLEVVERFCYLGDLISSGGGCSESIVARVRTGWKKFRELLPLLATKGFSLHTKGRLYDGCVRSAMLHGSETWAVNAEDMRRLERGEASMLRWMCSVSVHERRSISELRERMGIRGIKCSVQERRLRWYGHVMRMEDDRWVKKCQTIKVEGALGRGRRGRRW